MKNRQLAFVTFALAVTGLIVSSCDKDRFSIFSKSQGKGVGIAISTVYPGDMTETKAGGTAVLNNVFSSADEDFVIEEYVSDIKDVLEVPETKGTEIKQKQGSTGNNFNVANRQFLVKAYIDTVKTTSSGDVTVHVNEFNYPVKYSGSKWDWVLGDDDAPCWRTSTKYSIWSYWPMDGDVTSGSRSAVSEPDSGNWATSGTYNKVSFTHTVPKALEDQQDLLFAYNEETRDFAHIDGDEKKKYVYDGKEQTWIDNEGNDSQIFDGTTNPKSRNMDIHFYHALAAVKFELNSTTTGADVHSITLCCTDNTTSHNIILNNGIATAGSCTATGNPASTGDKVTFAWTIDNTKKKPLHYEFDNNHSVAGNYTKTGSGVLFMIPQTLSGVKIIVEFSKNGSTQYYTKVKTLNNVTWAAGKYYTYKLSIGEFHVPGEKMTQLTNVAIPGLKPDNGLTSFVRPEKTEGSNIAAPIPIKGVTKMGLAIEGYGLGAKEKDNQTVYMYCNKYGSANSLSAPGSGFQFDFSPVSGSGEIISFGGGGAETYYNCYSFARTEDQTKHPASNKTPGYYVFDTEGETEFILYFKPSAQDNSGGFIAELQGLIVLEVAKDPNLPGNFPLNPWP